MSFNYSGRARFDTELQDLSVIASSGVKGIPAVLGVTTWGDVGAKSSKLVKTWDEFQRNFGGLRTDSNFPAFCKFMLERGVTLRVGRAAHFTDPSDVTTITATQGTVTRATVTTAETQAVGTSTVTTLGANGTTHSIATGGYTWTATKTSGVADIPAMHTALAAAIMADTLVHGYGATVTGGHVAITPPAGRGAAANGQLIVASSVGGAIAKTNFTGGVDAILYTGSVTLKGGYATDGLNGATFTVRNAVSGQAGKVDIIVDIPGLGLLQKTVKNITRVLTNTDKTTFNNQSQFIKIDSFSGTLANGTAVLAGGTLVLTSIGYADYIGDATAMTGLRCFDDAHDFVRVAVPEMAVPQIDTALKDYAILRGDCRFLIRTPLGLSGDNSVDYRFGQGAYSHTAIDTWVGSMITGDMDTTDPATGGVLIIPGIIGALTAASYKDNAAYEWFAAGGATRGRIAQTLGIEYNLASPARTDEFDRVDKAGINAVVDDPDYGVVYWGNGTLQTADTMLKHENVADLMIYLRRTINPMVKGKLFDPNDIELWKEIYRRVKKVMDYVQKRRGLWKYLYQGDQDINDISEAVVNTPDSIDAGGYVFNLRTSPKVGMKYAGMRIIVTNSGVKFEELADQVF